MDFLRLRPTDSLYQQVFARTDIRGFEVHTEQNEVLGKVVDVLVDAAKHSYFLVLDIGSWLTRKRVMLLLPQFQVAESKQHLYVTGLSREQIKNLPVYDESRIANYEPDQQTSARARTVTPAPTVTSTSTVTSAPVVSSLEQPLEASPPLEASSPLEVTPLAASLPVETQPLPPASAPNTTVRTVATPNRQILPTQPVTSDRSSVVQSDIVPGSTHAHAPVSSESVTLSEETVRLLEERLIIDRKKRKVGEVIVRKAVETRLVEVPIRHETLIVEQISPERKQLASIDLHEGALEDLGLDLREPVTHEAVGDSISQIQPIALSRANQVLTRLMQTPRFRDAQVKMTFTDPELQAQYQGWLQDQVTSSHQTRESKIL